MMDWYVKAFLKSSLVWFGLGVTLGILMLVRPALVVYRTAHLHMNLLGFVTMMIFGVAYHVLPRFTGHPLHSQPLARAHVWMANAGLALLALGWMLLPHVGRDALPVQLAGGALSLASAYAFIYNIWRTIDGGRALAARAAAAQAKRENREKEGTTLPVMEGRNH